MSIMNFLLVYDRAAGHLVQQIPFGADAEAAVLRYQELEAEHRANPKMDIVLVGSDSLETIKITHRNYFDETRTLADLEAFLKSVDGSSAAR